MYKLKFVISGRGIIFNSKNEILLVSTDQQDWHTPGGMIDDIESSMDACIREVYEETGFSVKIDRLVAIEESLYDSRKEFSNFLRMTNFFYLCNVIDDNLEINNHWQDPDGNLIKYRKFFREDEVRDLEYIKSAGGFLQKYTFDEIKSFKHAKHFGFHNETSFTMEEIRSQLIQTE